MIPISIIIALDDFPESSVQLLSVLYKAEYPSFFKVALRLVSLFFSYSIDTEPILLI
jgi:hypothetical protein